ncbi:MAG TPA: aminotransferase class III-fold pyridoxal phosphate-dependent enzyme, partial [Oceanobacillus sp.]|nr:aminotransferase class III-fold pyridoxal phosphate-dependent enzyme [Oceanobacillus sp.]
LRHHLLNLQREIPLIGDVRGLGAMMLMELVTNPLTKAPAAQETLQVAAEALKRGVICMRAGLHANGIRFLPPLTITDEQIDEGMNVIAEALRAVESSRQLVTS